jgi:hypothetical protein
MCEEKKPFELVEKIKKYEHRWVKIEYKRDIFENGIFKETVDAEISGFFAKIFAFRGSAFGPHTDFIYVKNPPTRYFTRIYVTKIVSIQIDYEMEKEFGRDRCEANRLRERFYILSLTREADYL